VRCLPACRECNVSSARPITLDLTPEAGVGSTR
jgi:hypothetical protein